MGGVTRLDGAGMCLSSLENVTRSACFRRLRRTLHASRAHAHQQARKMHPGSKPKACNAYRLVGARHRFLFCRPCASHMLCSYPFWVTSDRILAACNSAAHICASFSAVDSEWMASPALTLANEQCLERSLVEYNEKHTCSQLLRLMELMRLFGTFAVCVIRLNH